MNSHTRTWAGTVFLKRPGAPAPFLWLRLGGGAGGDPTFEWGMQIRHPHNAGKERKGPWDIFTFTDLKVVLVFNSDDSLKGRLLAPYIIVFSLRQSEHRVLQQCWVFFFGLNMRAE